MQFEIFDIQSLRVSGEARDSPLKIFEPLQAEMGNSGYRPLQLHSNSDND